MMGSRVFQTNATVFCGASALHNSGSGYNVLNCTSKMYGIRESMGYQGHERTSIVFTILLSQVMLKLISAQTKALNAGNS